MSGGREKWIGWASSHQRPHKGLRVRMPEGFAQKGTGTIIQVKDAGLCQPSCKVKWDGGGCNTYFTGASVSRNAVSRPVHPEPAQLGLREFIRAQEWDPSAFSRTTVGDLIEVNSDAQWVFDLEALRMLVGHGAKKEQLEGLRVFGILQLKAPQGLRLEPLKNGTLLLTDLLEVDGDDFKVGIDELRELLTDGTTDKLLKKQLGHLRAFATRSQQQGGPSSLAHELRVSTAGAGHDFTWQQGHGPGSALPLVCASSRDVHLLSNGQRASYVAAGRSKAVGVESQGARDLLRKYPFTAQRLSGIGMR